MKTGDIIYHKNLVFTNNMVDTKKNRPCIFLFEEEKEDGNYIYSIPLTTQTRTFNKHSKEYFFVPQVIYSYKKLNFAYLKVIVCSNAKNVIDTGIKIDEMIIECILERVAKLDIHGKQKEYYDHIKSMLLYTRLFDEIDEREKTTKRYNKIISK